MTYPNWFERVGGPATFHKNLSHLIGKPIKVLQIGAYTGDATEWLINNILTHPDSTLTDVDPWTGSDEPEHHSMDWQNIEETYLSRHSESIKSGKLIRHKMMSDEFFATVGRDEKYDVIYVDGDHKAATVLRDGANSVLHTTDNGIIGFDDYSWTLGKGPAFDPAPAIEAVFRCNQDILEVIDLGYQFWVRRK